MLRTDAPRADCHEEPLALIVDRDDDSRSLYTDYLQRHFWRVVGASGGPEALAKAISEHPDLVISETRLPGFDGLMLCELLRKDGTTAHVPIVVITGDTTAVNLAHATAAGADAVLARAVLPEALLDTMQQLLAHSRALRQQSTEVRARAGQQIARSGTVLGRIARQSPRLTLKSALPRGDTVVPPIPPRSLRCPLCDGPLAYRRSHVGGVNVNNREQWDYFECPQACGRFVYRPRTRKLRREPD